MQRPRTAHANAPTHAHAHGHGHGHGHGHTHAHRDTVLASGERPGERPTLATGVLPFFESAQRGGSASAAYEMRARTRTTYLQVEVSNGAGEGQRVLEPGARGRRHQGRPLLPDVLVVPGSSTRGSGLGIGKPGGGARARIP